MKVHDQLDLVDVEALIPYARNSRLHSDEQVQQIANSVQEFGFTNPVLIDENGGIIAGHGRLMAARWLGMEQVPCIRIEGLSDTQKRAYVIADNQLPLNAAWDEDMLQAEIEALQDINFDVKLLGFDLDPDDQEVLSDAADSGVKEIATYLINDRFWISIRGPLKLQAKALERLREVMSEIPLDIELGTTRDG